MKIKVKLTMKITGSFGQICTPSTISYVFRKKGHKSIKGGGGSLRASGIVGVKKNVDLHYL